MRQAWSLKFLVIIVSQLAMIFMNLATASESDHLITFAISPDDAIIYSVRQNASQSFIIAQETSTGNIIKKIPVKLMPYTSFKPSLAITPDGKKLYLVDVNKSTYVVDLKTYHLSIIKNKPMQDTGREYNNPIIMMPDGKRLYAAEGAGQLRTPPVIHMIDTSTNQAHVVASRTNHYDKGWVNGVMTLDRASLLLYVSREIQYHQYSISIFDTRTHRLKETEIALSYHLTDMAVNPADGKLYLLSRGTIDMIDPVTMNKVDSINLQWSNNTLGMAFALSGSKLYVLDDEGMGKIYVINPMTHEVQNIKASVYMNGAWTSEIKTSETGAKVYVSTVDNKILVIDANTDNIIREILY